MQDKNNNPDFTSEIYQCPLDPNYSVEIHYYKGRFHKLSLLNDKQEVVQDFWTRQGSLQGDLLYCYAAQFHHYAIEIDSIALALSVGCYGIEDEKLLYYVCIAPFDDDGERGIHYRDELTSFEEAKDLGISLLKDCLAEAQKELLKKLAR